MIQKRALSHVCWYKKLKCNLNFTAVAESGKPTTSGKNIHCIIENASELQFKNRAPVNEATSTSTTHEQSTALSTSVAAQMPAFSVPQSPPSDVLPQLLNHCNPQTSSVIKITHYGHNACTFLQLWISEPGAFFPSVLSTSSNSIDFNVLTFCQTY